ncbi:NUDIX domain-containing protein [Nocardia sp. CA-129566]|uniref:NUDIX domain-containing protein n=1 Tax=Nocardia sp. CA-129566 TaxID=3239976 RepID=UPI003D99EB1B
MDWGRHHFSPGGHVEPGEPIEAALARELAEELGTTSRIVDFAGVVEHGYTDDGTAHHEINLIFNAELDGTPQSQEEHLEFIWLPTHQRHATDLRPRALKDVIASGARSVCGTANERTRSSRPPAQPIDSATSQRSQPTAWLLENALVQVHLDVPLHERMVITRGAASRCVSACPSSERRACGRDRNGEKASI